MFQSQAVFQMGSYEFFLKGMYLIYYVLIYYYFPLNKYFIFIIISHGQSQNQNSQKSSQSIARKTLPQTHQRLPHQQKDTIRSRQGPHQKLEKQNRWVCYPLDEENPKRTSQGHLTQSTRIGKREKIGLGPQII